MGAGVHRKGGAKSSHLQAKIRGICFQTQLNDAGIWGMAASYWFSDQGIEVRYSGHYANSICGNIVLFPNRADLESGILPPF